MARQCALCKRPPREGEEMRPMRIRNEDNLPDAELGLYSACLECVEEHRQRVAARLGKEPNQVTNYELC